MNHLSTKRLLCASVFTWIFALGGHANSLQAQNITDSFNYTVDTPISNYSGWSVPVGSAVVSSQYAHTSRSLRLAGGLQTEARRELGGAGSAAVLFVDLWIRPVVYDGTFETGIAVDGSLIGFTKEGATGKVMISHGATAEGAENWVDSGHRFWMNRDGCTASDWLRISIRQDSVNGYWDLYVNGKMFVGNIAFKDRGVDPGSLVLLGGGLPADVYVDDVKIWTSNPIFTDSDKDGMDNAFETANSFDTSIDDRDSPSAEPDTTRIQYYLNATHDWFVGQWAASTADTDEDGMPDSWELFFGLNPNSAADGPLDADGDGVSNAQEYLLGTSPVGNYEVKNIGAVMSAYGPYGKNFVPSGINNLGDIIGYYQDTTPGTGGLRYVVLSPSGSISVVFTKPSGTVPSGLLSINDMGLVVGYYAPLTPNNAPMFWWDGEELHGIEIPQTFNQTTTTPLASVDYSPGDWIYYFNWFEDTPIFNTLTNEYEGNYLLEDPATMFNTYDYLHYDVSLIDNETLTFNSSFVGLSNYGGIIGTYSSDYSHIADISDYLSDYVSYSSRYHRISSGIYSVQIPADDSTATSTQIAQNTWSGTAYSPVDVSCLGAILGTAKSYSDATLLTSGAYLESAEGVKTLLEHPDDLPLTPLKINRAGHALLKVTGSSPTVFGLAREGAWVPLNYTFPSGVNFVPVGVDDNDVVVGNSTGQGFGPALLSERGIVRLTNLVPEGSGWRFYQGSIVGVSDSGLILGTAPMLGQSGSRCFMMWRDDDQDDDGLPDDWERLIMAADLSGLLTSILAVLPGADADGDGLSNLDEYLAGTLAYQADSDNDGISDGQEVAEGTDPLDGESNSLVLVGLRVFTPLSLP